MSGGDELDHLTVGDVGGVDIGGDPARYMAELAAVERRFSVLPSAPNNAASAPTAFRASSVPATLRALPRKIARMRRRVTQRNYFDI